MRYMVDSVDCSQFAPALPVPGAGVVPIALRAGYANGSYHASSTRCGAPDVLVDVAGTIPSADVLDIETGDATPDTAPGWVKAHNAVRRDYPAILYVNRSNITAVANACAAAGLVVGRDYRWWISTLDGTDRVPDMTGVTAVQAWGAGAIGRNVDVSAVYDDAWKAPVNVVQGEIANKYVKGGFATLLGDPITPELVCPDQVGRFNHFARNNGSIYWTAAHGAFVVYGAIAAAWAASGWERGPLGYPLSDEFGGAGTDRNGSPITWRQSNFEHGYITWDPANGARIFTR